ncbi:MAG: DUF167 domain-containing protein [Chloroflexi bacterium]|nr:DUF167 domain-containing protein [Chloroflexota bacterium]
MSKVVEARIKVHVTPGAPSNEVAGFFFGVLKVKIKATPEKGKANEALVAYLAKTLGVRRNEVSITHGAASRNKIVAICGLGVEEVMKRLGIGAVK